MDGQDKFKEDKVKMVKINNSLGEEEEEIDTENVQKENEDNEEDEDDENKEIKEFTVELIIHTKVMDNREEIKKCICRNHIILDENAKEKEESKENENIYIEKEIIPVVEIPITRNENNQNRLNQLNNIESADKFYIKLNDLTKSLQKLGFPMSGSMINIFVNYANNYIFFGTEPIDNKTILYSYMLEPNKDVIKMKIINYIQKRMLDGYNNSIINTYFRKPIIKSNKKKEDLPSLDLKAKIFTPSMTNLEYYAEGSCSEESSSSLPSVASYDKEDYNELPMDKSKDKENILKTNFGHMSDSQKRERKIGYIIEKVYAWRKLYNGFRDDKNNFIKFDLENAAKKIDVSKKSLDDYLLQIRMGRKYGFDFDKNKYKKIGELREFVKKEMENDKTLNRQKRTIKKNNKNGKDKGDKKENIKGKIEEDKKENIQNEVIKSKENKKLINAKINYDNLDLKKSKSRGSNKSISLIGKKRKAKK